MSPRKPKDTEPKTLVAKRLQEFFDGKNFVEISDKIPITDKTVAKSLRGDCKPSYEMLKYVAENGGDVNYILTGETKSVNVFEIEALNKRIERLTNTVDELLEQNKGLRIENEKLKEQASLYNDSAKRGGAS